MNPLFSHKYTPTLVAVCICAATVAFGAYAYQTIKQTNNWGGPTTINVSGTGEVMAVPDIATFSFSVRAEADDAAAAQAAAAEQTNAVIAFMKESGVAETDIKTEGYNLMPRYRFEETPCRVGTFCPPGQQVADGFEVYQSVSVKVRDTAKSGELIAGAGERGATDISGLSFTIDDTDALKAEARRLAVEDAKAKAEQLAKDLDVRLVKMIGYYEDEASMPTPYYGMGGDMMARSEMAMAPDMPMGESEISSRVSLTYEIK